MDPAVMASDGRIMSWRLVTGAWVKGMYPVAGNQCRPTAKTATMIGAMTKGGSAKSPNVPVLATLSTGWFGRREVIRARGMATAKATTWEITISSMSMGAPVSTMWVTDSWLR